MTKLAAPLYAEEARYFHTDRRYAGGVGVGQGLIQPTPPGSTGP